MGARAGGDAGGGAGDALAESLTQAFLLLLERLTPDERAAFLLRTVFDYEYAEIGEAVGKSEAAARQLVSRREGVWASTAIAGSRRPRRGRMAWRSGSWRPADRET